METIENLVKELTSLANANSKLDDLSNEVITLRHMLEENNRATMQVSGRIEALSELCSSTSETKPPNKYQFPLERDKAGYSDSSWRNILREGRKLQEPHYDEAVERWGKPGQGPSFQGWAGTTGSPVVQIVATEPEYMFHGSARLPSRFQLTAQSRWGSVLRFASSGNDVLRDTIKYGAATGDPIGIYVEGAVEDAVGRIWKPFEQGVSNVVLSALNETLPVYLAQNQDRFAMDTVKILQHEGSTFGIKHGPALEGLTEGQTWLTDARFSNLQLGGPHSGVRPQAAMLAAGANIIISNWNLYGWLQGPYLHDDTNCVLNGIAMHHGKTDPDECLSYIICRSKKAMRSTVNAHTGIGWYNPKRSPAPRTAGYHRKGEVLL